ncbi:MAG: OadG family protein [Methylococcaceae bacterium]
MTELMGSGIELMFAGMGIVFLFLAMLVVAINFMTFLVLRFFPETPPTAITVPSVAIGTDKTTIAAITAALHQYRSKHK